MSVKNMQDTGLTGKKFITLQYLLFFESECLITKQQQRMILIPSIWIKNVSPFLLIEIHNAFEEPRNPDYFVFTVMEKRNGIAC
jgi:hypothetical protein